MVVSFIKLYLYIPFNVRKAFETHEYDFRHHHFYLNALNLGSQRIFAAVADSRNI